MKDEKGKMDSKPSNKTIKQFIKYLQEGDMEKQVLPQKNESFIFFVSFYESISFMPARYQHAALKVLIRYALYGEEPADKTDTRIMQSFVSWKKQIDANQKKRRRKSIEMDEEN